MSIIDNAAALVTAHEQVLSDLPVITERLKDTSIPLDERWQAFTLLVDKNVLVKNDTYGDGYIDTLGDNMTLYDDFNMERHETRTFLDMYQALMEAEGSWQEELVKAREHNLAEWQEEVLASGYSSFTYDW